MITTHSLFVVLGAAVGSVARYTTGRQVDRRVKGEFPWGTWIVNVLGTLLMGLFYQELDKIHSAPDWWALLGTGFCGAYTTFSTMSSEAAQFIKSRPLLALSYLGSSFGCGFLLFWLTQWI